MDSSVDFLLENLKQLVIYHVNLVAGAKDQLDILVMELHKLKDILQDASKKDENFKSWERGIRMVVYDIQDTIDQEITRLAADKAKKTSGFRRLFNSSPINLAETVKNIRRDMIQPLLNTNLEKFTKVDDAHEDTTVAADARETRQKSTKNIVGLMDETKEFMDFLNQVSNILEVASIVGMAGLGKTTLAWKIFEDPIIQFEFPVRIWVNVSESPNMENILRTILKHLTAETPPKSYEDLLKMVTGILKEGKFLIVLDDIWTTNEWEKIKEIILPLENHMGKVLVTTRNLDVAKAATNVTRKPHYMRFLDEEESWELLQSVVYENLKDVPPELKEFGMTIAKDCDGIPLSVVAIGRILLEKNLAAGRNILAIKEAWYEISKSVKHYLSYEEIPYELRNCFLYLGVFPKDADIPVKELIRLWIAEQLIQDKAGKRMEQVALENLKDLINRNLVMVKEAKFDGEPKICYISEAVRKICRMEAKYENLNLFQVITRSEDGIFEPRDNVENCRRLCIDSHVVEFFKQNKRLPKVRSFLCFFSSTKILSNENMALFTSGFGLLRVYNAKNIKFPKFPQKFMQLLHLRYLTLVTEKCRILPEAISELWNLQTLIMDMSSETLDIKADIWKMRQMRHLKTKATITLRRDGNGEGGENLQTLSRLSPASCTNEVFEKARNLITLGIQGELDKHCLSFSDSLSRLDCLQKLKFINQVPGAAAEKNPLRRLPESQNFPPNLQILVLQGTYMQWSKMSVLSQLQSLKALKLKDNAFTGNSWEAEYVFHHLESLHIERMSELVSWEAYNCPFPKLKFLVLNNCDKLIEVPDGVCENLETLRLERVTTDAVNSAEVIAKRKQENGVVFKLEIAPADKIYKP